jgi:DNA processing protein
MDGEDTVASNDLSAALIAVSLAPARMRVELTQAIVQAEFRNDAVSAVPEELLRRGHHYLSESKRMGLSLITYTSVHYPSQLRAIDLPPLVLFVKSKHGKFTFPKRIVGVVGARAASIDTCHLTSRIAHRLAECGFSVASGLALGVDAAAHRGALEASGPCPTCAVVAHGLDLVYPPSHRALSELIVAQGGAILSEYPPGIAAHKHHFLERNRIIAGLSQGVVVIAAGERSGSLVTARCAADYGRDVFVLQGDEHDPGERGAQRLLEDGAIPITGAEEVLAEYGLAIPAQEGSKATGRPGWMTVSMAECRARFGLSEAEILRMELAGRVVMLPGNRVSIQVD